MTTTNTTKTETRYRVRVKTFSGEIKSYPAKIKKEAEELFSREVRWDCPEENKYVQLEDSGRERVEYSVIAMCDLTKNGHTDPATKPVLTDETITYTIVERDEQGKSPFYARVLVPGQAVQDFDPIGHTEWWKHTKSDLVFAVNKAFKGAWYLKAEEFEARVAEQTKIEAVATSTGIAASEVAKIAAIAQEAKQGKQAYVEADAQELAERTGTTPMQEGTQETAYHHTWDGSHHFYYHRQCVQYRLPEEVTFDVIPLASVPQEAECEYCYTAMHKVVKQIQQEQVIHYQYSLDDAEQAQSNVEMLREQEDCLYVCVDKQGTIDTYHEINESTQGILHDGGKLVPRSAMVQRQEEIQQMEGPTTMKDGLDVIQQEMAEQVENRDWKNAHIHADHLLINLVNILTDRLGDAKATVQIEDILRSYDNIGKWYE